VRNGFKLLLGRLKTLLGFRELAGLNRIKAETGVRHTFGQEGAP
jgi:hypothetical protein